MGQGGGAIEAGDPVVFAASFVCEANSEFSIGYSLVMIEGESMSSMWPSGFEDQSAPCEFQVQATGGGGNCQFQIATPSNLANSWNGCVVLSLILLFGFGTNCCLLHFSLLPTVFQVSEVAWKATFARALMRSNVGPTT